MEQNLSRWIPLSVALVAGLLILWRAALSTRDRRSPGQWLIYRFYKLVQTGWAIARAIDVGYLEYRRVLQETRIEMENERCLGKMVKGRVEGSTLVPAREQEA